MRSLEALAHENASEGCARETWAPLEASHQAIHATDPALRDAMRSIAEDEQRHAALAMDLDLWFQARLDPAARARLEATRQSAIARLVAWAPTPPELGLPTPNVAHRLLEGLRQHLWPRQPAGHERAWQDSNLRHPA